MQPRKDIVSLLRHFRSAGTLAGRKPRQPNLTRSGYARKHYGPDKAPLPHPSIGHQGSADRRNLAAQARPAEGSKKRPVGPRAESCCPAGDQFALLFGIELEPTISANMTLSCRSTDAEIEAFHLTWHRCQLRRSG
jgi:hypothetical protein